MAYKINDVVIRSTGGVYVVSEFKKMTIGKNIIDYLCLKPYYADINGDSIVYVPTAKSEDLLRPVLTKDEAMSFLQKFKVMEPIWINDVKERKNKFTELLDTGVLDNVCLVLKSLYAQQQKLSLEDRALNLMDYDRLKKLKKEIGEELSVALEIPLDSIGVKIEQIINE